MSISSRASAAHWRNWQVICCEGDRFPRFPARKSAVSVCVSKFFLTLDFPSARLGSKGALARRSLKNKPSRSDMILTRSLHRTNARCDHRCSFSASDSYCLTNLKGLRRGTRSGHQYGLYGRGIESKVGREWRDVVHHRLSGRHHRMVDSGGRGQQSTRNGPGKDEQYVASYSDCYKKTAKGIKTKNAITGCLVGTVASAALWAIALSSSEEN